MQRGPKPRSAEDCQQHQKEERERPRTDPPRDGGGEPADTLTSDAGLQTERRLAVILNHPVCRALPWWPQDVVAEIPASYQPAPQSRAPHPTLPPTHSPFQGSPPEAATSPAPTPALPTRALDDRCGSLSRRCCPLWSKSPPPPPQGINRHLGLHYLKAHRRTSPGLMSP